VPKKHALPPTQAWGRTPVIASIDGNTWKTSVWWDTKSQSTLLPVPKKVRGDKGDGDWVIVTVEFDHRR
jgi:hypothetical protein